MAIKRNAEGKTAFELGFAIGKRDGCLSCREAFTRFHFITESNVDEFLNGVEDGVRNDRWRLTRLRAAGVEHNAEVAGR